MKLSSLLISMLCVIAITSVSAKELAGAAPKQNLACSIADWQADSVVSVYFVRQMFTTAQRQALLEALRAAEATRKKLGLAVTFDYAGETDGLVDCNSCLTVARQDVYTSDRKSRVTLNPLRHNDLGQLISAWMGIDRAADSVVVLSGSMLDTLRRVRSTKALSACKS